jgi:hypothetical protein
MNRNGHMLTVSVTQMVVSEEHTNMQYLDLQNNRHFSHKLAFEKTMAGR